MNAPPASPSRAPRFAQLAGNPPWGETQTSLSPVGKYSTGHGWDLSLHRDCGCETPVSKPPYITCSPLDASAQPLLGSHSRVAPFTEIFAKNPPTVAA